MIQLPQVSASGAVVAKVGTRLLSERVFEPGLPTGASTVRVTVTSTDGGTQVATFTNGESDARDEPSGEDVKN
jgi:hypothetical protein